MSYELIKNWLSGKRNYTVGCILYNRYGTDEELKILFEKGKTDYTEKKLLDELKKLTTDNRQPTADEVRGGQWSAVGGQFPESSNKIIHSLREQWMPLYTEMNYKRHELDKFLNQKTDAATRRRAKLAMEILLLEKRCMMIWQQRDHYIEFGRLPAQEKTEPVVDPVKVIERYKNVQCYIRRYKMYLRKDPADAKSQALLKQYEAEFELLKKQCATK